MAQDRLTMNERYLSLIHDKGKCENERKPSIAVKLDANQTTNFIKLVLITDFKSNI